MGYNTVAVLYNDMTHEIARSGPIGDRMASAIRHWSMRDRDRMLTHFGAGMVISQEHADYEQVVIVARNSGQRACDATDLGRAALSQMKECLERHGYKVTKPRKPKAQPPSAGGGDELAQTPWVCPWTTRGR